MTFPSVSFSLLSKVAKPGYQLGNRRQKGTGEMGRKQQTTFQAEWESGRTGDIHSQEVTLYLQGPKTYDVGLPFLPATEQKLGTLHGIMPLHSNRLLFLRSGHLKQQTLQGC